MEKWPILEKKNILIITRFSFEMTSILKIVCNLLFFLPFGFVFFFYSLYSGNQIHMHSMALVLSFSFSSFFFMLNVKKILQFLTLYRTLNMNVKYICFTLIHSFRCSEPFSFCNTFLAYFVANTIWYCCFILYEFSTL